MRRNNFRAGLVLAAIAAVSAGTALPAAAFPADPVPIAGGFDGARGVVNLGKGYTLVADSTGTISRVHERPGKSATVTPVAHVPGSFVGAQLDQWKNTTYILTPGTSEAGSGGGTLYKWKSGYAEPRVVADITAYQADDPDPYDLEDFPTDSNPYGLAALDDGTVLVADAAGNDLLRVWPNGTIKTVALLKPRVVAVPEGLPEGPPAGTEIPSEAVATSVAVGPDGSYYVGELRGFPATPGTSQIWRVRAGSVGAVCDPEHPQVGKCRRYADGLTSITDLTWGRGGLFALSLSKMSWLAAESGAPGSEVGGLFQIGAYGQKIHELAKDQLILPGAVDADDRGSLFLTGPLFGPGGLSKLTR